MPKKLLKNTVLPAGFRLESLPKAQYRYHELHYTYTSDEHYLSERIISKNGFSFTFRREKRAEVYFHDSYDVLYDNAWKHCTAYGVFAPDGKIAAYFELAREEWNDRMHITNLLVEPPFRRRGIGSALLRAAKCAAETEDRRILTLETQSCNVPAIDFYLANGFVFSGTNLYFYSNLDPQEDEVMIEMAFLY